MPSQPSVQPASGIPSLFPGQADESTTLPATGAGSPAEAPVAPLAVEASLLATSHRPWWIALLVAIALHGLLLATAFFLLPPVQLALSPLPAALVVDLVTLPTPVAGTAGEKAAQEQKPEQKQAPENKSESKGENKPEKKAEPPRPPAPPVRPAAIAPPRPPGPAVSHQAAPAARPAPAPRESSPATPDQTPSAASEQDRPASQDAGEASERAATGEQARAPSAGTPLEASLAESRARQHKWQEQVLSHLQRYKTYPQAARERGEEGIVQVRFRIRRDGEVISSQLLTASGSTALNQEAVALVTRASPLPPPPADIGGETIELSFPMRFSLH